MFRSLFIGLLLFTVIFREGISQTPEKPSLSTYSYRPPSAYKPSWQRLNLMMSATYFFVVKEGEVDFDSCLLYSSHSLGLSRIPVLAEGINDPELLARSQWVDKLDPASGIRMLTQEVGKKRLNELLLLGAYYAFQPRVNYRRDSVEYFLRKVIDESKALKEESSERIALCLLGKMYFDVNEVTRGDSVLDRLIQECRNTRDIETEARAFFYRGFYTPFSPETMPRKITYFNKAAEIYHGLKNPEDELKALTDAGYLLVATFQLQEAHDAFLKALTLADSISYPYRHYVTDALAMATILSGKFGEPLIYSLETIRTAEATRDSIGWAYFYSRLGWLYYMEGEREEESLKWFLKGFHRFLQVSDPALSINLFNITCILYSLGRGQESLELVTMVSKKVPPAKPRDHVFYNLSFGKAYHSLKQYQQAEQYVMEAARVEKQFPMVRGAQHQSFINLELGLISFDAGQYERSRKHLEAFLADPFHEKIIGNDLIAYSTLISIDSALGDATSAVNHYRQYRKVQDSTFRVSKIRQAEELQVMYETEEKENEIALLNEQAKLRQANLKQATLVKNMTIAGIVVALMIAILLYRQSRHRQKTNKVITRNNEQLQHLLTEKEWLLREIHHRVKNNLQVVMSLLNSQAAYIDNEPALTAIQDSQHRVHAMSLIHQKLYRTENLTSIDMSVYIREMVNYLADSFDTGQRIRFEFHIEPVQMDVGQAVPLGLILNEAITNALKYAFPKGRIGVIAISLVASTPNHYELRIDDNGVGFPADFQKKKASSLGMSLMRGLSEDLDAEFSIESREGTNIKVSFVYDQAVKKMPLPAASLA